MASSISPKVFDKAACESVRLHMLLCLLVMLIQINNAVAYPVVGYPLEGLERAKHAANKYLQPSGLGC